MKDFNVDRGIWFPNQIIDGDPTECVGLSVCEIACDKDGTIYDPDFSYAMAFRLQGKTPDTVGVDAWAGMQGAVAYGLLPMVQDPFPVIQYGELYVANWQNYSASLRQLATIYARNGAKKLKVDFDVVMQRIFDTKQGVALPMTWHASFMTPDSEGRLPPASGSTTNHMVVAKGQKTIDGEVRMGIKPHLGKDYGDGGFAYMSMAQFYQNVQMALAFDDDANRWLSLLGIAITKYPYLEDYVTSLYTPNMSKQMPAFVPTVPESRDLLKDFCTYIRDYEGSPGDRNYKNNNPGNCRYSSVGYLAKYGHVEKDKDGFAIFKDYATGFLYLENLIRYRIRQHPDWTVLQLMNDYAPTGDNNNPTAYAENLARRLGVDTDYKVKNLIA